ncbi:MAG TPA: hypothetical protein VJ914_08355 [Pseudonocardiaceae bacterium]|nr:hypothetical protein [Pseudonocardiaceae bacterium]
MTLKKRSAALLVVPALALGASLLAGGVAAASTPDGGGGGHGCRAPLPADGLSVVTCVDWADSGSAVGTVTTSGSNNTTINLCVEVVDANQNLVPGSRNCQPQPGPSGFVQTPNVSLRAGTYYVVSYFTSPTYWYGGETQPFSVS